jgi:hypothetical protein
MVFTTEPSNNHFSPKGTVLFGEKYEQVKKLENKGLCKILIEKL